MTLQPLREVAELPAIIDEWNCAAVTLRDGRVYRCVGRGAGGAATAEAIVAAVRRFVAEEARFTAAACRANAEGFSNETFREKLVRMVGA